MPFTYRRAGLDDWFYRTTHIFLIPMDTKTHQLLNNGSFNDLVAEFVDYLADSWEELTDARQQSTDLSLIADAVVKTKATRITQLLLQTQQQLDVEPEDLQLAIDHYSVFMKLQAKVLDDISDLCDSL